MICNPKTVAQAKGNIKSDLYEDPGVIDVVVDRLLQRLLCEENEDDTGDYPHATY